jgi:hypothetical protein
MKIRLIILSVLVTILLTGCSSTGDINFINKTKHNVYVTTDNKDITVPGNQNYKLSIDTGKQFLFTDDTKKVKVGIDGETYCLDNNVHFTYINVEANKTSTVYFNPSSASIKVINNSDKTIKTLSFTQHFDNGDFSSSANILTHFLEPNESDYFRILPSTTANHFYYTFSIVFTDSTVINVGDQSNVLEVDDQYLWEVN